MRFPTRYIGLDAARARHGDRVDRFGAFFVEGDPLADDAVDALAPLPREAREALVDRALDRGVDAIPDAPAALRALFAHVEHVPFWVDRARADRGGAVFLRSGPLGGLVLGTYSLVAGYCSPAGNKPLAFSGRLEEDAPRRLAETGKFVQLTCARGGLRRDAPGFRAAVRVRLIHAAVRRALRRSPKWDAGAWGEPINQVDMAGTVLLFSYLALDGLQKLGMPLTRDEREDLLHLWRYAGWLQGVREELLCATEAEAAAMWDLLSTTQAMPDDDARALATALMRSGVTSARSPEAKARAERAMPFGYAVSRYLVGERYADALGYPATPWRFVVPVIRALTAGGQTLAGRVPRLHALAVERGMRYWQQTVALGLGGAPATFPMPEKLRAQR